MLNTINELDNESLTYDSQNISTSTLLQVPFYETISTLNTIAKLDDENLTYDGQNSSTSTLPQVLQLYEVTTDSSQCDNADSSQFDNADSSQFDNELYESDNLSNSLKLVADKPFLTGKNLKVG
ncbi:hypothetical protein F8M41_009266 [Gigaspora margarita]|uniref:Uncharacterized protein n=1 Tax=Gigaspora margarita TaxID=4874 RepID=A0A8H4EVN9_GIGMA|nr:hypothetical protein F8M41_009266 [Gigaspora margarita]